MFYSNYIDLHLYKVLLYKPVFFPTSQQFINECPAACMGPLLF